jgi:prevent-host-death family protein
MKRVKMSEVSGQLNHYLREASEEELLIMRNGKPAGVLIGFNSEEDWLDYLLENNPHFAKRIAKARQDLRAGRGISLEEVTTHLEKASDA